MSIKSNVTLVYLDSNVSLRCTRGLNRKISLMDGGNSGTENIIDDKKNKTLLNNTCRVFIESLRLTRIQTVFP